MITNKTEADLPPSPTLKQATNYLNVSDRTGRRYIANGWLKAYRVGPRLIRVDRESVLKLARPVGGAAAR